MTLIMTVAAFSASIAIMIAITKSFEQTSRAHSFSSVQLVKLYVEISVPGDWSAPDGTLHKGEHRLVANKEFWESLEGYLEPGTTIRFGAGEPPPAERRDGFASVLALGPPPDTLAERFLAKRLEEPVPTKDGAFIAVGNKAGEPVGWIAVVKNSEFAPRLRGGRMLFIVIGITGFFLVQATLFGLILLRVTRPIESIAAAHEEAKNKNDELSNQSRTDHLTGLLNRRGLQDRLGEMHEVNDSFVALLDVDHFKMVNDERGHDEGDRVLSSIAATLTSHVRSGDLCCRWGGEEFIVVFNNATRDNAMASAERIRAAIEARVLEPEPSSPKTEPFHVSVTIGVAAISEKGFPEALKAADRALYKGKRDGRNRVVSGDDQTNSGSRPRVEHPDRP